MDSKVFARHGQIALLLLAFATAPACADKPQATENVAIHAGFETYPSEFFSHHVPENAMDANHGFFVLTDVEAFLLLDRKGQRAAANWPPKPIVATFEKTIRLTYQADSPTDCSVLVCPALSDDGKSLELSISAPGNSTFSLKGKVDVRLAYSDVLYVPSRTLLDDGQRRLYLVLSLVRRNGEE